MKNFTKKFLMTLLMLTCVFALTACGEEKPMSEFQKTKLDAAQSRSTQVVRLTKELVTMDSVDSLLEGYNNIELGDWFTSVYAQYCGDSSFQCEGKAVKGALTSFQTASEKMGGIKDFGTAAAELDGDTIVVTVDVIGESATGSVELIFTNDIYLKMKSCTLNLNETKATLMMRAVLNTVLGMGTVFAVLILISFIISLFSLIPKLQESLSKKAEPAQTPVQTAAESASVTADLAEEELADDTELAAVIAAAVAAYEGTGADGFRVRSIRRANTGNWKRA